MKTITKTLLILASIASVASGQIIKKVDVSDITGLGTAATTAATAYAPSSIQSPQESLASAILFHDDCSGDYQTMSNNGTRAVEPGPGTMTAVVAANSGAVRYERGEVILSIAKSTGNAYAGIHDSARTVSAGLTCIVRLVPSFRAGGAGSNVSVGFSTSSASAGLAGGAFKISQTNGLTVAEIQTSSLSVAGDPGNLIPANGLFREGQEIALAVTHRTLTNQQYWMQGGEMAAFGATIGSDNWIMVSETFADLTGVTVYPSVFMQAYGTCRVRDFKVLSTWIPSSRHVVKDFNVTYSGTHCPALAKDPVSGLVVCAWNRGTTDANTDQTIRYSTRLASGAWTDAATLVAAPGGANSQQIGNLSVINGALWLIHYTATSATDGGTLCRTALTVNPTTGAITNTATGATPTTATATTLNFTGGNGTMNLAFNPAVTISSGRIFLPISVSAIGSYSSYSDDNGATWSTPFLIASSGKIEPTFVVESDGAIGCMLRAQTSAYYTRCASPASAPTSWSSPVAIASIPQPGGSGSRMQFCKLASGEILLAGNDHQTIRRNPTVWRMGDAGAVYGKVLLGDYNPELGAVGGTALLRYPAIIEDGAGNILTAISRLPSAVATSGVGIQIDNRRWEKPVSVHAGGSGTASIAPVLAPRPTAAATYIAYSTAPTPDCTFGERFYITLTGSGATFAAPLNPLPWQDLFITVIQDGTGSRTIAGWNSIYQLNGATCTLQTAASAANMFRFQYNAITAQWVLTGFN